MKTILFIVGGIFIALLLLFVYAAFWISGKQSDAEEKLDD